jgi:hypothetical protein
MSATTTIDYVAVCIVKKKEKAPPPPSFRVTTGRVSNDPKLALTEQCLKQLEIQQGMFLELKESLEEDLCVIHNNIGGCEHDLQILPKRGRKTKKKFNRINLTIQLLKHQVKVREDMKALVIYALNADATGYKKRIKQFKRHASQMIECYGEACRFETGTNEETHVQTHAQPHTSFIAGVATYAPPLEDEYINVCDYTKVWHDLFCGDWIELISSDLWRFFRGKTN